MEDMESKNDFTFHLSCKEMNGIIMIQEILILDKF